MNRFVLMWLMVCSVLGCQESRATRRRRSRAPSPSEFVIAQQREQITQALEQAVSTDEDGRRLLAFYRERAHYIELSPAGRHVLEPGTAPSRLGHGDGGAHIDFLIAPSTRGLRDQLGLHSEANFEYLRERSTIFTPLPDSFTSIWLGVRTAHELSHVYDDLRGIERFVGGEAGEQEFAMGEARAHSLEMRLLNLATHGAFERELRRVLDHLVPPDADPHAWVMPDIPGDFQGVYTLFPPPRSQEEQYTRDGSCLIAINFLFADQHHDLASPFDRRVRAYRLWRTIRSVRGSP